MALMAGSVRSGCPQGELPRLQTAVFLLFLGVPGGGGQWGEKESDGTGARPDRLILIRLNFFKGLFSK